MSLHSYLLCLENSLVSSLISRFLFQFSFVLHVCVAVTTIGLEGSKSYMEPGELQRSKGCPDPTQPHLEARHSSLQQVIRLITMNTFQEKCFLYSRIVPIIWRLE